MSDAEVDENGDPLPDQDAGPPTADESGQTPIEASITSGENDAAEDVDSPAAADGTATK